VVVSKPGTKMSCSIEEETHSKNREPVTSNQHKKALLGLKQANSNRGQGPSSERSTARWRLSEKIMNFRRNNQRL